MKLKSLTSMQNSMPFQTTGLLFYNLDQNRTFDLETDFNSSVSNSPNRAEIWQAFILSPVNGHLLARISKEFQLQ